MKAPIEWYKGKGEGGGGEGLKGCYATVAKIQDSFQNMKKYSMVSIKTLNNFFVEFVGTRAWKV